MFIASRERSRHKGRENWIGFQWVCCWSGQGLLGGTDRCLTRRLGKEALGTPRFVKTRFKVLFSLQRLLAKAELMKPLDFFYLVETWGRWLKCFQVFLASEKTQKSFRLAGGLYARLGVRQHLLPSQAAWAAGEFVPHKLRESWDSLATPQRELDRSNHPRLCCQSSWRL